MIESAQGDDESTAVTSEAQRSSNWKAWARYCAAVNVNPWRPDTREMDFIQKKREDVIWNAALPWIWARMEPAKGAKLLDGRPKPPKPSSALAILRGIRAVHVNKGVETPPLTGLAKRCREQMHWYLDEYGQGSLNTKHTTPFTHKQICAILAVPEGAPILPHGKPWSWKTQFGVSTRAYHHTGAQSGLRKSEKTHDPRRPWGARNISFGNLSWRDANGVDRDVSEYCDEFFDLIGPGWYAVLRPPPGKADAFGMKWGDKPIWLPYCHESAINAARALADWEKSARVQPAERSSTPLFCGPDGVHQPLTGSRAVDTFDRLKKAALPEEEAKTLTLHSYRAYLASALMAAGCSDAQIQAMLRWASPASLASYKQINDVAYGDMLRRAEQVKLTGARVHNLPRPPPRVSHEDMAIAYILNGAGEPGERLGDSSDED